MKKIILFCLFFSISFTSFSQIGLTSGVQFFQASEWENHIQASYNNSNLSFFEPTLYVGVDYWFRLKNKRVEFTPELAYSQYRTEIAVDRLGLIDASDVYTSTSYSLFLNTNFYLLDFGGDCNCPTFNKDGDLIKKGFFIRLSPAIHYNVKNSNYNVSSSANVTNNLVDADADKFNFGLRAGAGLDIGISAFITLTPMVLATYNLPSSWGPLDPDFVDTNTIVAVESPVINFFAGLRLGFRFDELNKYGYR